MTDDPEKKESQWGLSNSFQAFRDAGPIFGLGIQMAAAVVLAFFAGRWLDEKWGTAPWMMLVGLMFGAGAGMFNFIRTVNASGKNNAEKEKKS